MEVSLGPLLPTLDPRDLVKGLDKTTILIKTPSDLLLVLLFNFSIVTASEKCQVSFHSFVVVFLKSLGHLVGCGLAREVSVEKGCR